MAMLIFLKSGRLEKIIRDIDCTAVGFWGKIIFYSDCGTPKYNYKFTFILPIWDKVGLGSIMPVKKIIKNKIIKNIPVSFWFQFQPLPLLTTTTDELIAMDSSQDCRPTESFRISVLVGYRIFRNFLTKWHRHLWFIYLLKNFL